ncbi:MAG: TIR domain-containing protein [Pseudomonadales bacterium]|nr:TIR domain-containing protein [Pseudomonadales bacterium]
MQLGSIFISYKTGNPNLIDRATSIYQHLNSYGYTVWMDRYSLQGGEAWDTAIFTAIPNCDILLLLVTIETKNSAWVRREVDIAKGSKVTIIPLILEEMDIEVELDYFYLRHIQAVPLLNSFETELVKVVEHIEASKTMTKRRQEEWLDNLLHSQGKIAFTPPNQAIASYQMPDDINDCQIILAGGDMTYFHDIDVIVHSENTYMQMARVFEVDSLSSRIRWQGAHIGENGHMREDTVQQNLYSQIVSPESDYALPVNMGVVIPAPAGHSESLLARRNKARYLFHTATVKVHSHAERQTTIPPENSEIALAVSNCLEKTIQVNENKGVVSFETEARQQEESETAQYNPIASIIFPIFATGQGGRKYDVAEITMVMLRAIQRFFHINRDRKQLSLRKIYLCGYSESDVQQVQQVLDTKLTRIRR